MTAVKHADSNGSTASAATTSMTSASSRWEELFHCPAPQRLPSLVEQAIAWREQVLCHGDVSGAIAHDLQLAVEHALQRRRVTGARDLAMPPADPADVPGPHQGTGRDTVATHGGGAGLVRAVNAASLPQSPRSGGTSRTSALPPAASQLLPGSQLIKAYGGRNHIVAVEAEGFRYEGEAFSSLSAIAKHITGTHWNGLLFFGLRKRRSYPPKPRRHG